VTRAATSKGILQTLQSSFKWLLCDFMKDIVRRYIGATWTLESIAAMGPLQDEVDIADYSAEVLAALGRTEIAHFLFLNALYHCISVNASSQLYLHDLEATSGEVSQAAIIDCWQVPCAPSTPLFLSIAAALKELVFSARRKAKEDGDLYMPEVSALERELNVMHKIVEDASSATTRWKYLVRIIRAIESNHSAWENWQLDLMRVSLALHQRSAAELNLLKYLSQQIVADVRGKFSIIRRSDGAASDRDVCLWTMLQSRLRRELGGAMALLDFVKGLVPESRIDEISNDLIVNMGGSEPIWDALEQQEKEEQGQGQGQIHGQELTATKRAVAMILSCGLDEMWQRLNSLDVRDLPDWMARMRVLLSIIPGNPATAAKLLPPLIFCR
jgi:hypothetical protein